MSRKSFINKLKVKNKVTKNSITNEKEYTDLSENIDFSDKVALKIHEAIKSIETETKEEEFNKIEYMINLNKIISNWEELRPILTKYFEENKLKKER